MVVALFYSTSVLEDETLDSMMQAMDVLAHDIRPGYPEVKQVADFLAGLRITALGCLG